MSDIQIALFDVSGTLTVSNAWTGITMAPQIDKWRRRWLMSTNLPFWLLSKSRLYSEYAFRYRWIKALAWLLRGFDRHEIDAIFDWGVNTHLVPQYRTDIIAELEHHKSAGATVIVVSNIFQGFVDHIVQRVGADAGIGTDLAFEGDVATGRIMGKPSAGDQKVLNVEQFLAERALTVDLQTAATAYADSISDVPLLSAVKAPNATYPDKQLMQVAQDKHWRIIS